MLTRTYWRFMFLMAAINLYMLMQHYSFARPILALLAITTAVGMLVTGQRG